MRVANVTIPVQLSILTSLIFILNLFLRRFMHFNPLLKWYSLHQRELPWRQTTDPYKIWLSEIILQQTRVDQGMPYYHRFLAKFPTVAHLARARSETVFKLWQGLGYYNRAENLIATAKIILHTYKGVFPDTYEELLQLKGIGPYTAAAISSIAFNRSQAVVDGNVSRVIARLYAVTEAIDSAVGKKLIQQLADVALDKKRPGMFNQAMMELGARVCTPRNPDCISCPMANECIAFATGKTNQYPVKAGKQLQKERFLHFLFILENKHTYIYKRTGQAIWKNLYEPPFLELDHTAKTPELLQQLKQKKILTPKSRLPEIQLGMELTHHLSHQKIQASFWIIQSASLTKTFCQQHIKLNMKQLNQYPVHRLFDKFLKSPTLQVLLKQIHVS